MLQAPLPSESQALGLFMTAIGGDRVAWAMLSASKMLRISSSFVFPQSQESPWPSELLSRCTFPAVLLGWNVQLSEQSTVCPVWQNGQGATPAQMVAVSRTPSPSESVIGGLGPTVKPTIVSEPSASRGLPGG